MTQREMTPEQVAVELEQAGKNQMCAPEACLKAAELIRTAYGSERVPQAESDFDIVRLIAHVECQETLNEAIPGDGAKMFRDIAALLKTHPAYLNPPPLTKEQLFNMGGKSIWVDSLLMGRGFWATMDQTGYSCKGTNGEQCFLSQYGDRWFAYLYPVNRHQKDRGETINGVTADKILAAAQLKDPDAILADCLFSSFANFVHDVESRCITSYDGIGDLAIDGKVVTNATLHLDAQAVSIGKTLLVSFKDLSKLLGDRVNVFWCGK